MARKKYIGKNKKRSPISYMPPVSTYNWDGSIGGLFEMKDDFGHGRIEREYGELKTGLMEMGPDIEKNFYEGLVNPYAGLTDPMQSLEVKSEDLEINKAALEAEESARRQTSADMLQNIQQSGNVQNIQQMLVATERMAQGSRARVAAEERQNQLAMVQEKQQLDMAKAKSKLQTEMQIRQGEFQTDMQMRKGAEEALGRKVNLQQALLGLVSGELQRADVQEQQAESEKSIFGWKKWLRW